MYFAVTNNLAIVGYKFNAVAFESLKKRNDFVKKNPEYKAIPAKKARLVMEEKTLKRVERYPQTIYNNNGRLVDFVL